MRRRKRMRGIRHSRLIRGFFGLTAVLAFFLAGCTSPNLKRNGYVEPTSTAPRDRGPSPLYYDFDDVLVPSELKVDRENSFIYRAAGIVAGVLALSGRVEVGSLTAFFENNMARDNWKIVSAFKSPRTMMLFQKENRWCVIIMSEAWLNTSVEIWVSPTMGAGEGGRG
jgi:hypothetical protein